MIKAKVNKGVLEILFSDTLLKDGRELLLSILDKRTTKQNAYLHVIFQMLSNETGYTLEQIKHLICLAVGHSETFINRKTGEETVIRKKTSNLSKKEFSNLVESIIQWCAEHNYYIQTPEEYFNNLN